MGETEDACRLGQLLLATGSGDNQGEGGYGEHGAHLGLFEVRVKDEGPSHGGYHGDNLPALTKI